VDSAAEYFISVEKVFANQKMLYVQKLDADFEVIRKLLRRKHVEMRDKIESIYDENLNFAYRYIDGLDAMKNSINSVMEAANVLK